MGMQIQSLRKRAHMSQRELAAKAGMSTRALRDIERGRVQRPQLRTIQHLAAALELAESEVSELHAAAREKPARKTGKPQFLILGTLVVQRGETVVPVGRPMLRRLIGLLVLKHPEPATHQEIVETLWPSGPPHSYQSLIHTYVSQVRQLLEPERPTGQTPPSVERIPNGYVLRADGNQTDMRRFDELVARARRTQHADHREIAYESLTQALQCWRGPVLSDVDPVLRQHPAAVAATERRLEVALLHADLALALGRPEQSVKVLWEMANSEPLHEGVHARLMLTLAGCGEQAAALNVFKSLRERLDEELGITPGEEIREAHMRVLRQQIPRPERAGFPSEGPRTTAKPAQLPAGTSSYVGRGRQIQTLNSLLDTDGSGQTPIVTVVGPPGVGKTALVLHWAHARREHFDDGQLFVNLRGHSPLPALSPVDVLARFLRALGAPPDQVPSSEEEAAAMYRTLLADKRMLIVLDNANSVDQVRPLLPGNGECCVVITSRSRLAGLVASDGARHLGLEVLNLNEAHTLLGGILGERRAAAEPDALMDLARLCGWLPLAIRIAAANLIANSTMSVAQYCAELAGDNLISGLRVEGDERSTIRAAFDLSYLALPEPAQRTFRLLSLTPGSDITSHGAAALIGTAPGDAGRLLRFLADAHLVQEVAPGRFGMHDLLRSYARELARDEEEARDAGRRLLDWYVSNAEAAARLLYPEERSPVPPADRGRPADALVSDAAQASRWFENECDNLVSTVLHAAKSGDHRVAWRLAEAMHGYLSLGLYTADWLTVATAGLSAATADNDLRARSAAQLRLADWHWVQGSNAQAQDLFTAALESATEANWLNGQAMALRRIGAAHQENGAMREASDYLSRARDLTRQAEGVGAADDLMNLGLICWKLGRLEEAVAHYSQAARLFRDMGSPSGVAVSRTNLGIVYRAMGRPSEAVGVLSETLDIHVRSGNKASETVALSCLSAAHSDLGDHVSGQRLARAALDAAQALRNRRLEANAFFSMGAAQERALELESAANSYRQALHLAEVMNDRYPEVYALIGVARTQLRTDQPEQALATAGKALTIAREAEFRVLEASALNVLAFVRLCLGEIRPAMSDAQHALVLHRQTGHRPGEARSHMALGCAFQATGAPSRAFGHWRKALLLFRDMSMPGFYDVRPRAGRTAGDRRTGRGARTGNDGTFAFTRG
ncbi:BTAD domain-containing putative transcriptional regulator [Streptomyces sp. NPDC002018]|uniref:BTAD domain-containing putative transcriptional regulator n=1 Tax=Streptomyces sp. NPDC002018 TaxID=3364629 RepID=UPI0036ABA417